MREDEREKDERGREKRKEKEGEACLSQRSELLLLIRQPEHSRVQ